MLEIINDLDFDIVPTNDFHINKRLADLLESQSILNIFVTSQKKSYVLNVTYEDEEHTVIKDKYTILSKNVKQKTDISTPYISLTNSGIIYYIPYKNSQDEN